MPVFRSARSRRVSRTSRSSLVFFLLDAVCFLSTVLAILYLCHVVGYSQTGGPIPWLFAVLLAVPGGLACMLLGRWERQVFHANDPQLISAILGLCCVVLLFYPLYLQEPLKFAFDLPLTFQTTLQDESTPMGTITFRDNVVRRFPGGVVEWGFIFFLNDPNPGKQANIRATFFELGQHQKALELPLQSNSPPQRIADVGSYDTVHFRSEGGVPVQIAALASAPTTGLTALMFHFGRLACLLLPLGAAALASTGIYRYFTKLKRFKGRWSRPFSDNPVLVSEPTEPTCGGWLRLTKNESIALTMGMMGMIVFRIGWFAVPWLFTRDDISRLWFYGKFQSLELGVWVGRYSFLPLHWLFDWLTGCTINGAQQFFAPIGFAFLALSGLYMVRIWKVAESVFLAVAVILCLSYHPYMQELLTYKGIPTHFPYFFLVILSIAEVRSTLRSVIVWGFVFSLGAAAYQSFANVAATTLLFAVVFEGLRELRRRNTPSLLRIVLNSKIVERTAVMGLGVVFFFVCRAVFWMFFPLRSFGYQQSYAETVDSLSALQTKIDVFFSEYLRVYAQTDLLIRFPAKMILLALVGLVFVKIAQEGRGDANPSAARKRLFLVVLLWLVVILASIAAPFAAWLPVKWNLTPYRAFMMISAFWAGVFAVVLHEWTTPPALKKTIIAAIVLVLSVFMIVCSQASFDVANLILLDRTKASRIIADLEKHPDFSKVKRLCLLPINDEGPAYDYVYPTQGTRGVFGNSYSSLEGWSTAETYNYLTGYKFDTLWDYRERMYYAEKYADLPVWPTPGCVVVDDDTAIIRVK